MEPLIQIDLEIIDMTPRRQLMLTWYAALSPPLSAMFSPSVCFPLICLGRKLNLIYYANINISRVILMAIKKVINVETNLTTEYGVIRVLIGKTLDSLDEIPDSLIPPPLMKVSLFVILPALIIKCMSQLVTHDDTHGPKVQRLGVVDVIKGRLEDSSRKYCRANRKCQNLNRVDERKSNYSKTLQTDLILGRSIISIDCWRCHFPFSLVGGFNNLFQILQQRKSRYFHIIFKIFCQRKVELKFMIHSNFQDANPSSEYKRIPVKMKEFFPESSSQKKELKSELSDIVLYCNIWE